MHRDFRNKIRLPQERFLQATNGLGSLDRNSRCCLGCNLCRHKTPNGTGSRDDGCEESNRCKADC